MRKVSFSNDVNSLAHSKWRCQYHIVFAPKYRRQEIYGQIKADVGKILRHLCEMKGIEIIEAELCPDYVYMLVSIPPKYSVAQVVGYLKGKSALMIFDGYTNLKYKYGNRHFWCRGYFVDIVGRNRTAVAEYIRNQLQQDIAEDRLGMKEYIDQFMDIKNKQTKENAFRRSQKQFCGWQTFQYVLRCLQVIGLFRACTNHQVYQGL